jgi:hypothetical protein
MLKIVVILLMFVAWLAIEGGVLGMPMAQQANLKLRSVPLPKRFSLRTLLLVTTLIAVAFGLVAWLNR